MTDLLLVLSPIPGSSTADVSAESELYREITVDLPVEDGTAFTRFLDENPPEGLAGYYEILYQEDGLRDGNTRIVLYFAADDAMAAVRLEILTASLGLRITSISEKKLDRQDYLTAYMKHYRAFAISPRMGIVPSWQRGTRRERALISTGRIPLILDPGLAFGTGRHATTALCIGMLETIIRPGMKVIDAGTGSGILSIAALLLGAGHAYAFDIDSHAARTAAHNRDLNPSIADRMETHAGSFELMRGRPADLLIANITAQTILGASQEIAHGIYPAMLLSGVLFEQLEEVTAAFPMFRRMSYREDDGWIAAHFERIG